MKLDTGVFQWKSTEQIYPFEKADDGSTLYCKQIVAASLPASAGWYSLGAVGISDARLVHRIEGIANQGTDVYDAFSLPYTYPQAQNNELGVRYYNGNIEVNVNTNYSAYNAKIRIIYKK